MYKVKIVLLIPAFILTALLMDCKTQKPVKAEFEYPSFMADYVKADFQRQCIKGEVLYDISCAKCHNVKVKRRMVIPDFTSEQINGYDMRLANPEHQNNLTGTQVTTEELGYIMSFLSYKKKSGVPAVIAENFPK